jgi:hypothetical protein
MEWDFNANQEVDEDTLGKAPEGFRGAYEKGDDGKFRIGDGFKPFVEAITGLNGALGKERGLTKNLKGQKDVSEQLKETLGFESLEDAKARFDELNEQVTSASKVDPAKIKADIQKTFDGEISKKDAELENMRGTLNRYMVDSAAVSALAEARGNSKLLMPLIREQVELEKDGDDYVVRVKDGQGSYRGDGKGGFMTIQDLVAEMRASKDYGAAFESDNEGGTGTGNPRPGAQHRVQTQRRLDRDNMSANDRIQAGLEARRNRR